MKRETRPLSLFKHLPLPPTPPWRTAGKGYHSPMKPHPKLRKALKWLCASVCAAIMFVSLVTLWLPLNLKSFGHRFDFGHHHEVQISSGALVMYHMRLPPFPGAPSSVFEFAPISDIAWTKFYGDPSAVWVQVPVRNRSGFIASVPLWMFVAASAGLTSLLWWRDRSIERRIASGMCPQCGYNRLGLEKASKCPECGAGVKA